MYKLQVTSREKIEGDGKLRRFGLQDLLFVLTATLVLAADQLSKHWIREALPPGGSYPSASFPRLTYVTNTGSAFGLFNNQAFLLAITAVVGVAAILLYYRYASADHNFLRLSLGLQLGGAVGNLTDRVRFGQVTDFIEVGFWPVFNLADSAIVVGVVILAFFLLFSAEKQSSHA